MNIKRTLTVLVALVLGAGLVPYAGAQSVSLTANVPFDFYVAGKLLPAGHYVVKPASQAVLRIYDDRGNSAFILAGNREVNRLLSASRLTFRQYGEMTFFTGVYWSGSKEGWAPNPSRLEKRVAREMSASHPTTIAAK